MAYSFIPLIFARSLDSDDSRQRHARLALSGEEHRVSPGVYADKLAWDALTPRDQYIHRIRAVVETRAFDPVLVSHESAAALHGLPVLASWPRQVHVTIGRSNGGKSRGEIVKHSVEIPDVDVTTVAGLRVTTVVRTVIDIAANAKFMSAVVVADHALRLDRWGKREPLCTPDTISAALDRRLPARAHARISRVIRFATTQSDSPLESVSRVSMHTVGIPRPVLQQQFSDYRGLIGFSEFYWPDFKLIGEADGRSKYTDPRYRNGRTLEEVLLDEKKRADRLRAIGLDVSRWGWDIGVNPESLRRHLEAAGLPSGQPW